MSAFSIESLVTHAEPDEAGKLVQWVEVKLLLPKDFDWTKGAPKLLKSLEFACGLIGRGSEESKDQNS